MPQVFPSKVIVCSEFRGYAPPRVPEGATPPICRANPQTQYANKPKPYTMKFIIMVWFAFLARHRPVSTMANPACMNITRNPVTRVHTKLMATRFCPTWLTASASVTPFVASAGTTSLTVPVLVPPGSPLARSSVEGGCAAFTFNGTSIAGPGAGGGAAAAGAAVCAQAGSPHNTSSIATADKYRFRLSPDFIVASPWSIRFFPFELAFLRP